MNVVSVSLIFSQMGGHSCIEWLLIALTLIKVVCDKDRPKVTRRLCLIIAIFKNKCKRKVSTATQLLCRFDR